MPRPSLGRLGFKDAAVRIWDGVYDEDILFSNSRIDIGSPVHQNLNDVIVAVHSCEMQRLATATVLQLQVNVRHKQHPHHGFLLICSGQMQRRLTGFILCVEKGGDLLPRPLQLCVIHVVSRFLQRGEEGFDDVLVRVLHRKMQGRSSGSILCADVDSHLHQSRDGCPMAVFGS